MNNNFTFLFVIAVMMGCSESTKPFTAREDTHAYANVNDYPGKGAFVIPAGTVCEMGKTVIGKVDAYTEVRCQNGHGWILTVTKDNFEPTP
jgi:hypothetical protein